jgi:TldD protein
VSITVDLAEEIAPGIVDYALKQGASYADVRVQFEESTGFVISEGVVEEGGTASLAGMGVRVIVDGAWGFCSTDDAISRTRARESVDRAIELASASAEGTKYPVTMAPTKAIHARVSSDLSDISQDVELTLDTVIEPAKECERRAMSAGKEVLEFSLSFSTGRSVETFASSDGSLITQANRGYLGTLYVVASSRGTAEYYPYDFGGLGSHDEFLNQSLPQLVGKIAEKACEISKSRSLPSSASFKTVIMDPTFVALWVHETIGHPLEADRVLGGRGDPQNAPWTCTAFGNRVAFDSFSVVDNPSIETPAWMKYDSEGVESRNKHLISSGVVQSCIHNRETAQAFQVEPNGGARSPSYRFVPMPRMSNTCIEPGDWSVEEIIEDTRDGILVVGGMTPIIDSRAIDWKISAKEAYAIAKGQITGMFRDVVVSEATPDFLISLDALGKNSGITVTPDCSKGSPLQTLPVGNGGPAVRGKAYLKGVA